MVDFKKEEFKDEFIVFKDKTIKNLNKTIENKINEDYKKSVLLTYWIKDYNNFLKKEETYKPNFQPELQQGSIIQINLGFRLGNEQGGLHYAIVLDKKDNKRKSILTVVPLSSIKSNKKLLKTHVNLGSEVYNLINLKTEEIIKSAKNHIEEIDKLLNDSSYDRKEFFDLMSKSKLKIKYAEECNNKSKKLKKGSYAICEQIVTISKMRVYDPITTEAPLYNLKISEESLQKIRNVIIENYI